MSNCGRFFVKSHYFTQLSYYWTSPPIINYKIHSISQSLDKIYRNIDMDFL
jgi:hypothetical protein